MSKQIAVNPDHLTKEMFDRALPKQSRIKVTDDLIDEINSVMNDPQLRENFRDNILSHAKIMADGKYKIESYLNAVRYVSHKSLGSTNIEAYAKTFPSRYQRLVDEGANNKVISAYSTAYNKTDLVVKITSQALVPIHILNADILQQAINKQASIMNNCDASYKVQSDAANSLMTHLRPPEASKVELDISIKQDKSLDELRETTLALARQQRAMIESGAMNAKDIAHSKLLINGEIVND